VKDFNPYKGVRLITYAVWWIRGYIREYLLKQFSMVKIGTTQDQKKLYYNLMKEKEAIRSEGLLETTKLISHRMGVSEKDVRMMEQRLGSKDVSLDQPMDDEGNTSFLDLQRTANEEGIDDQLVLLEQLELLKKNIDAIRTKLNERELFLLEHRLLADNPMTLQEVGDKYKITREAVRQTEERLISKIKEQFLSTPTQDLLLGTAPGSAQPQGKDLIKIRS
jgi:RNA polymerase sigma-32 factor